jgi:anthranilate synthase/aminodeoxychorismate synthase-like glutamine amidotransferase
MTMSMPPMPLRRASVESLRVVIIDNYDSFVYNLYQRIGELTGVASTVVRNDQVTVRQVAEMRPTHIIISPGPGNPQNPAYFGVCREVILELGKTIPLLGVCLGHQGIGAAFGGRVVRAPKVMHGKTSVVFHNRTHTFQGLDNPTVVMRYHSLILERDTLPPELVVNAATEDGIIMGFAHRHYPIYGVQFHPESIGSRCGPHMLQNFLESTRR